MNTPTFDRPLPHSPEAERVLLGSCLLERRHVDTLAAQLKPDDFYVGAHRAVFLAVLSLASDDSAVDPLTVWERLKQTGRCEDVPGGLAALDALTTGLPSLQNLSRYVEIVGEKSALRAFAKFGFALSSQAVGDDAEPREVGVWADSRLAELTNLLGRHAGGFRSFGEMSPEMADRYERMFLNERFSIPTGFVEFDGDPRDEKNCALTGGGFGLTDLVVIAGKASHGKTALALDIAVNMARAGFPGGVISCEMEREKLFMRAHAAESGVARWKIRGGIFEQDFKTLVRTIDRVAALPVHVADDIVSLDDLCAKSRRLVRQQGARFLVVDYIQLLELGERVGSRNNEVGKIARTLKNLALTLKVPVIALSQLSRDHDRDGREPELRDLRDSGEIEQHADTVVLLFGDKPEENATFREVHAKVAKQREGKLFRRSLVFNGELLTFRTLDQKMPVDDKEAEVWKGYQ